MRIFVGLGLLLVLSHATFSEDASAPDSSHGLQLRLTITHSREQDQDIHDIRLELINTGAAPVTIVGGGREDFMENSLLHANVDSVPELFVNGFQTMGGPGKCPRTAITIAPLASRVANWKTTDTSFLQQYAGHGWRDPPLPGTYQARASIQLVLRDGPAFVLTSNPQPFVVGGSAEIARSTVVHVLAVDREHKTVKLDAGSNQKLEVGDVYDIQRVRRVKSGRYRLKVVQLEPAQSTAEICDLPASQSEAEDDAAAHAKGFEWPRTVDMGFYVPPEAEPLAELSKAIGTKDTAKIDESFAKYRILSLQPQLNAGLRAAVQSGDLAVVKSFVARGADVNAGDARKFWVRTQEKFTRSFPTENTPLFNAVSIGRKDIAEYLIDNGASMTRRGEHALHVAANAERLDIAAMLCLRGADLDAGDPNGMTALHCAVRVRNKPMIELLLRRGADVRAVDKKGQGVLAYCSDNETAELLVSKGAAWDFRSAIIFGKLDKAAELLAVKPESVNEAIHETPNALVWTAKMNRPAAQIKLLLSAKPRLDARDDVGRTALHWSACFGNSDSVRLLLDAGADPNSKDRVQDWTPLHLAALFGQNDVIELLLSHGADIERPDFDGGTPLHLAAKAHNIPTIQLLLEKSASLNPRDRRGRTPLYNAVREARDSGDPFHFDEALDIGVDESDPAPASENPRRSLSLGPSRTTKPIEVARLLLSKKPDIQAADQEGDTMLHEAVLCDDVELATLLLDKGADANAKNKLGQTPIFQLATAGEWYYDRLGAFEVRPKPAEQFTKMAQLLVTHGAEANLADNNGDTPLHIAAGRHGLTMSRLLLEWKLPVEAQNKLGRTPLHAAAAFGDPDMIQFLIDRHAAVNAADKAGQTPLHLAAGGQSWGDHLKQTILTLLQNGAHANATDNAGQTPRDCAEQYVRNKWLPLQYEDERTLRTWREIVELLRVK